MEPFGKCRAKHYHPIEYAGNPYFQTFHPIEYSDKRRARLSHSIEYANNPSAQPSHPFRCAAMGEKLPHRGFTFDSPGLPTIGGYPG